LHRPTALTRFVMVFVTLSGGIALGATPGCGTEEAATDESPDAALVGTYEAADGQGAGGIASISFDGPTRYRLRRSECAGDACQERGEYAFDRAARSLRLSPEAAAPYSLPFAIRGAANTAASESGNVAPKNLVDGPTQLITAPATLLVANQVQLLNATYTGTGMGRQRHLFIIRTKGFIAPITNETLGDLGSRAANAALYTFSIATNANFSENPPNDSRDSGQYRLFAQVYLDVTCNGSSPSMQLTDPDTDAGYEGPLKAGVDTLQTDYFADGRFAFQAQGRPHPAAEPAFQAIKRRTNNTIWYKVGGSVTCDGYGNATLNLGNAITTKFPSFRLWVTQSSNGQLRGTDLVVDRPQGNFSELWFLPAPPAF